MKFRDAELELKFPKRERGYYGSMHSLCETKYLTQLTRERTESLKHLLKPVEEGDICN